MKKLYIAPVADIAFSQMQTYLNDGSDKASWGSMMTVRLMHRQNIVATASGNSELTFFIYIRCQPSWLAPFSLLYPKFEFALIRRIKI